MTKTTEELYQEAARAAGAVGHPTLRLSALWDLYHACKAALAEAEAEIDSSYGLSTDTIEQLRAALKKADG